MGMARQGRQIGTVFGSAYGYENTQRHQQISPEINFIMQNRRPKSGTPPVSSSQDQCNHFSEWCHMTAWNGILDCYMARSTTWRMIWLLVVSGGCFLAINQTVAMIMDYWTDEQWVTSVSYEFPKGGGLKWPNMTVCTLNWPHIWNTQPFLVKEAIQKQQHDFGSNSSEDKSSASSKGHSGPLECSEIIVGCAAWPDDPQRPSNVCCESSTRETARCIKLIPGETFEIDKKHSTENRIYYLLDANIRNDSLDVVSDASAGFQIRLYLGETYTYDEFSSTFLIQPGTTNVIGMVMEEHRTTLKKRLIPFTKVELPCNKPYEYLKTEEYSQQLCHIDCAIHWGMKFCGCSFVADVAIQMELKDRKVTCANKTVLIECYRKFKEAVKLAYEYESEDEDYEAESGITKEQMEESHCFVDCPEPCTYSRVEAKISNSLFLPPSKISRTKETLNKVFREYGSKKYFTETDLAGLTLVELYYEIGQQRVVERTPRLSIEELISNIGGCLGVWSGISFLSLFQIFYYCSQGVSYELRKCCCASETHK